MQIGTTTTNMLAGSKSLSDSLPTSTAILRCILSGNFLYFSPGTFSLEGKYVNERSPRSITDALREMAILNHPFDIQIFNRDLIEFANNSQRGLMVKVSTLPLNLLILARKKINSFSATAAFHILSSRDLALSRFQFSLRLAQEFGILNHFARGEGSKIFNANVNADRITGLGNEAGLILFYREDYVPPIRFALNSASLDRSFYLTRKANSARSNFSKIKPLPPDLKTLLWVCERVILANAFKSWVSWFFSCLASAEECGKCYIYAPQYILKRLGIHTSYFGPIFFYIRKLSCLGMITNRLLRYCPRITPLLNSRIV